MPRKNGHNLIIPKRDPVDRPDLAVQCKVRPECDGCAYPRHGFICDFSDGSCLKTRFDEIMPPHPPMSTAPEAHAPSTGRPVPTAIPI